MPIDVSELLIPMGILDARLQDLLRAKLPDPVDLTYWESRHNRTFYIDYTIDECYALVELSKVIVNMNYNEKDIPKEDLKPIYIYIMSYGGDSDQAMYFCDLMLSSRIPIITIGTGVCMSSGFLIFLSGHRRYAFPHCQMLVHSGSAGFQGTAEQVKEAQKNYEAQIKAIKQYVLGRTSIPEKIFNKNKSKDWYLNGDELIKYNIINKFVEKFEDID